MTTHSQNPLFDHQHVTVIEPRSGWHMLNWRELWAYRELLWVLTSRDIKVRYKQTVLGAAWAIIRPVAIMAIFSIVFGSLAKMPSDGLPYPVFVYAALLPWTFFAGSVSASAQSLVGSAHLVSKVYFPRLIIPLSSAGAALVDLGVSAVILLLMMGWYNVGWTWQLLAVPPMAVALSFTALGVGTLLSAATVSYRDFSHITPFLVQIWMYITPVVFPISLVPERWHWLLYLNPMTGLIEGFRSAFLGTPFNFVALSASLAITVVVFVLAIATFERVERRFADVI
jgi:lipopolysaccharide transport system permease protein